VFAPSFASTAWLARIDLRSAGLRYWGGERPKPRESRTGWALSAVPILLALGEGVRFIRSRLAGGAIAKPGWRYLVLGLILGASGFLTLFIFALVAGLALTFAIWAQRSARTTGNLPRP
jgi:hypothetical protein